MARWAAPWRGRAATRYGRRTAMAPGDDRLQPVPRRHCPCVYQQRAGSGNPYANLPTLDRNIVAVPWGIELQPRRWTEYRAARTQSMFCRRPLATSRDRVAPNQWTLWRAGVQ